MTEEQFFRLWITLGGCSLVLLFVGALTNKVTVFRNYSDVGWSVALISTPIVGGLLMSFIAGEEVDLWTFAMGNLVGQSITAITGFAIVFSTFKIYVMSIQDNGLILGLIVGTAKILIAVIIAFCAFGLISYLLRDQRKLGHIAIFFMVFAIFGWFINILVNGERTGAA